MKPLISIIHASARPNEWAECYARWMAERTEDWSIEYILAIDRRMSPQFRRSTEHTDVKFVINNNRECCVDAYNAGAEASTGDVLILQSDDMYPPPNWYADLTKIIPSTQRSKDFVIHCATWESSRIDWQVLSRGRYERLGYALNPEYMSMNADCEFTMHAYQDGVVIDARHIHIDHRHPHKGTAKWDAVYRKENGADRHEASNVILHRRIAQGFPVTCDDYYKLSLALQTDIVEHLPALRDYAKGKTVLELGVRHGHSTSAFLSAPALRLVSVDHARFEYSIGMDRGAQHDGVEWRQVKADSRQSQGEFDLIFFDTWHTAQHLREEIAAHEPHAKEYMIFHDVESCGTIGEDNGPGIMVPINELLAMGSWEIETHLKNNNGLLILRRRRLEMR